jgi:hypothetical protein
MFCRRLLLTLSAFVALQLAFNIVTWSLQHGRLQQVMLDLARQAARLGERYTEYRRHCHAEADYNQSKLVPGLSANDVNRPLPRRLTQPLINDFGYH